MFAPKFSASKLKMNIQLATTRLKMLQKKRENMILLARKEVALLLEKGKDDLARIKVEQVIRDDYVVESMELLEMYCSLISTRFGLITEFKECDPGVIEAIQSMIWATPRMQADVAELKVIKAQFLAKYGKEFVEDAMTNRLKHVNERIIHKLSVHTPASDLIEGYLRNIAAKYKVNWHPAMDAVPSVPDEDFGGETFPPASGGGGGGGFSEKPAPPYSSQDPYRGNGGDPSLLYPPDTSYPPPAQSYPPQQNPSALYPPEQPASYPPAGPVGSYGSAEHREPSTDSQPSMDAPPGPEIDSGFPRVPQPGQGSVPGEDSVPDFDELTRRFQALRDGRS